MQKPSLTSSLPNNEEKKKEATVTEEVLSTGFLSPLINASADEDVIEGLTKAQWEQEINDVSKLPPYAQLNKMWLHSTAIVNVFLDAITSTCMCKTLFV